VGEERKWVLALLMCGTMRPKASYDMEGGEKVGAGLLKGPGSPGVWHHEAQGHKLAKFAF